MELELKQFKFNPVTVTVTPVFPARHRLGLPLWLQQGVPLVVLLTRCEQHLLIAESTCLSADRRQSCVTVFGCSFLCAGS